MSSHCWSMVTCVRYTASVGTSTVQSSHMCRHPFLLYWLAHEVPCTKQAVVGGPINRAHCGILPPALLSSDAVLGRDDDLKLSLCIWSASFLLCCPFPLPAAGRSGAVSLRGCCGSPSVAFSPLFVPAGQIGAVACPLSRLARSVIRNICCELGSVGPVSGCMALKALAQCGVLPLHHMECPGAPPLDSAEMFWHCLNWSLPAACGAQDNMRLAMSLILMFQSLSIWTKVSLLSHLAR